MMSIRLRSRFMHHLLVLGALFLLIPAMAEEPPSRHLKEELSPEEFRLAGLEKLSDSELEYLSALLYGRQVSTSVVARQPKAKPKTEKALTPESQFGSENIAKTNKDESKIPDSIQSSIVGKFAGWSGGTVFELENGQVWKQISRDRFKVSLTDPKVEILKGSFGSYFLKVEGYGSRCKVRRIK